MDTGRGEERVKCVERVTWKLTVPYVKSIANGNLLYGSGNSNRGSVSAWKGRMGKVRDLFMKTRDTKGTFHSKMGTIRTEMVWT